MAAKEKGPTSRARWALLLGACMGIIGIAAASFAVGASLTMTDDDRPPKVSTHANNTSSSPKPPNPKPVYPTDSTPGEGEPPSAPPLVYEPPPSPPQVKTPPASRAPEPAPICPTGTVSVSLASVVQKSVMEFPGGYDPEWDSVESGFTVQIANGTNHRITANGGTLLINASDGTQLSAIMSGVQLGPGESRAVSAGRFWKVRHELDAITSWSLVKGNAYYFLEDVDSRCTTPSQQPMTFPASTIPN